MPTSHGRKALAVGVAITVAMGALVGWQGFRLSQAHNDTAEREMFVQTARQGALNLTTIDWEHADRDVQRVLDSATGAFREDFAQRSQPFIDVVKKARSRSEGSITESALESQSPDGAQVLVVARVAITNAGAAEQEPRRWRMRMSVQKVGDEMKISQVAFVP
ncbi:mammalian cell entry protein [Mycolicibacterium fortuitum]|nr:mammalian cell entry protein [Mycolicibacterium fortuitum]